MNESDNYIQGDHVIIEIPETDVKVVGKIEEVFHQGPDKIIRYNEYFFPEKTSAGRQSHHSKNEVYKTDEIEKEFYTNIKGKCEVMKLDHYIRKILSVKEKRQNVENVFFFRQKYTDPDDFTPDLPNSCYCSKIFNPDRNFIQCKECKELIHVECFLSAETKKCSNDLCNNNIEIQLNTNANLIGTKRIRKEEEEKEQVEKKHKEDVSTNLTLLPHKSDIKETEEKSVLLYNNLSESRRKYLVTLIDQLEKKNAVNKPSHPDERTRKNMRDIICQKLLYGVEEIKEYNDFSKIKVPELSKTDISESLVVKMCSNLSVAIESAIYLQNNESLNNNYKKKFKFLFPNLSDCRNYELRFGIINGDITPAELIKMNSEDLAPSSLKNRRIERQNKYFKEQVLMKDDMKIIAKTHKGEAILSVDNEPGHDEYYMEQADLEKKKKAENENRSDKGSWYDQSDDEKKEITKKQQQRTVIKKEPIMATKPQNESKYKNISKEMNTFYNTLGEYRKENLILKLNDKLKSNLKQSTYDEILKFREEERLILPD